MPRKGARGLNFHDARGTLTRAYPYAELRDDALANARRFDRARAEARRPPRIDRRDRARVRRRFLRRGLRRRVAGAAAAADQLRRARGLCRPARRSSSAAATRRCSSSRPSLPISPAAAATSSASRAATGNCSPTIEPAAAELPLPSGDDIAYLQYSSGSTRFPHGVAVTHRALLDNLRAHGIGLEVIDTDRCISWLPWYHDMGLVGCLLSPVANQISVDYLKTEDFARRPLAWLDLITRNPGHLAQLLADLRLRHLLAPDELADPRRGPLRPVALADRRQRRRHDPARRHAGVRRQLRRGRLQGRRLLPQLRPRRGDARGLADAAGRRHPPRAGRGKRTVRRRHARPGAAAPLPRHRQLRQAGQAAWKSRSAAPTAPMLPDRAIGKVYVPRRQRHARLFPRRGSDRAPASSTTVGSTPATWATCRAATSSSSAAPRT